MVEPVPQFTPYVPPKILTHEDFSRTGLDEPNNSEIVPNTNEMVSKIV